MLMWMNNLLDKENSQLDTQVQYKHYWVPAQKKQLDYNLNNVGAHLN